MKSFLFLLLIVLISTSPVLSQKRKVVRSRSEPAPPMVKPKKSVPLVAVDAAEPPPPPPPRPAKAKTNERFASDVFKDITINKWGVAAVSIPDDLTAETEATTPTDNGKNKWMTYSRYWKQSGAFYPSSIEADLDITTWEADFKSIIPELRPDLATPENLVLLDFTGDFQAKNKPGSFVREAQILKIGGIEGAFSISELPSDKNRFLVAWSTYRYYQNKAQRISLTVTGRNEEMTKALKIINSIKLETTPANSAAQTP